jgi:Na+/H+ antiporter NhaD/arsenite permease-like protein
MRVKWRGPVFALLETGAVGWIDVFPMHPFLSSIAGGEFSISPVWILPFALLLALIATMPLSPHGVKRLWEKFYPLVAIGLGLIVAAFYLLKVPHGGHEVFKTMEEYFAFIVLIGSLFVVAGNIHISIRGEARPLGNMLFLLVGALLANLIGTTGASMVLIRPWIRMNKYRITAFHIVFFIFVVSNVGGALTPIGDPPLFLGYLHGVPFFWLLEKAMLPWLFTLGLVLAAFFAYDCRNFRRAPKPVREQETSKEPALRVEGMHNLIFLLVIVGGVFMPEAYYIRQIAMLAAAAASYFTTRKSVREANEFSFGPIKEVGFLFVGIFATMMPALDYLKEHGQEFGFNKPVQYYVSSGALSSVLDNAPTYLNFLTLAESSVIPAEVQAKAAEVVARGGNGEREVLVPWLTAAESRVGGVPAPLFIIAVSLGSVFFGAMTYIGNGPNFMVKSIADSSKVRTPSFFGYIFKYSLPILLPILLLCGWLFL